MSDLDRQLAQIAARQHSLITLDDVLAVGGDHHHVTARLHGGRWRRVAPRAYLLSGAPLTWEARALAAVRSAGPGAAVSHLAAARLHGIPGYGSAGVEISVPRGTLRRRLDARVHESTDLDRCRIVEVDGIPVTGIARTILDLGRYVGPQRLLRAIEACRRADAVSWADLIRVLATHARKGRHGIRRLRAVILAEADRTETTDSDLELLVLGLLREHGLPEPVLHHRVFDGDRFVAEVDLAYPEHRIAIECDGSIHGEDEVRERDLPRQNDLVLVGWTVLRFTWKRVRARPAAVAAEVSAAIRAATVGASP
jgi:very-short-patch-repair endonuclease